MFQPEVKLEFVKRYCSPADGWEVFVDIDASEMGDTGGPRKSKEARTRQEQMQQHGRVAKESLCTLGVQVGGCRADWFRTVKTDHPQATIPSITGDRDIVAIHPTTNRIMIAEVEGDSSGQPEQTLYKAIGQIIVATHNRPNGWAMDFVVVVHGDGMRSHLAKAVVLANIGVSGLAIACEQANDEWLFHPEVPWAGGFAPG